MQSFGKGQVSDCSESQGLNLVAMYINSCFILINRNIEWVWCHSTLKSFFQGAAENGDRYANVRGSMVNLRGCIKLFQNETYQYTLR